MAVPTLNFTLHVAPTDDVAEGEGDMDSLFPHTPRNDASWFEADPPAELIEQCLRPGHCVVPEGEVCEWFHRKLAQLGHAFNEVGNTLMAHTWFECAYAARASSADLISAANMRLKLGQWALVEQLYLQIVRMVLTDAQREIVERKLNDVAALKAGSAPMPGACALGPRTRCASAHHDAISSPHRRERSRAECPTGRARVARGRSGRCGRSGTGLIWSCLACKCSPRRPLLPTGTGPRQGAAAAIAPRVRLRGQCGRRLRGRAGECA